MATVNMSLGTKKGMLQEVPRGKEEVKDGALIVCDKTSPNCLFIYVCHHPSTVATGTCTRGRLAPTAHSVAPCSTLLEWGEDHPPSMPSVGILYL